MSKKEKLILVAILLFVISLFAIVFYASFRIASIETNYQNLADSIKNIKVINGIDGQDGKPGLNGSNGINGSNGVNGINAISTNTIERHYVQLPPEQGRDGQNGADGPSTDIQLNPQTRDLETKKSNEKFWTVLIPCSELLRSCPDVTLGIGNE